MLQLVSTVILLYMTTENFLYFLMILKCCQTFTVYQLYANNQWKTGIITRKWHKLYIL